MPIKHRGTGLGCRAVVLYIDVLCAMQKGLA